VSLTSTLLINFGVLLALMLLMWIVSLLRRDVSIVDSFWGFGFVVVAWLTTIFHWPISTPALLITVLVTIWGLRLSGFLFWRKLGEPEDPRYGAMREKHGDKFWWVSLLTVFGLQGILIWFISLPVQVAPVSEQGLNGWHFLGLTLWSIGFFFESVGDYQLAKFKADESNKEKVLDSGLWRYTRHPNYFGDFCVWWGIYLLSVGSGGAWTVLSPVLIAFLLLKVSGVTMLEKDISNRRPKYESYKKRTNAFFPWFPVDES
jgi:steroid 5-alpha reductase family enzyme